MTLFILIVSLWSSGPEFITNPDCELRYKQATAAARYAYGVDRNAENYNRAMQRAAEDRRICEAANQPPPPPPPPQDPPLRFKRYTNLLKWFNDGMWGPVLEP